MFKKILLGIIVLAIGFGILLSNFYVLPFEISFLKTWPLLVILIGIGELFDVKKLTLTSIILLIIGSYFLLYNYEVIAVPFSKIVFPLLLIVFGVSLLLPKNYGKVIRKNTKSDMNVTSVFSDVNNRSESKDFKKVTITTIFGGATVDLRNVTLKHNECICEASIVFSGVDIFIPEGWEVNTDGLTCIFGGVENKSILKTDSKTKNILYLTGTVIFGGIDVK